jgi:cyclic beta-1,2-glucan synthetase
MILDGSCRTILVFGSGLRSHQQLLTRDRIPAVLFDAPLEATRLEGSGQTGYSRLRLSGEELLVVSPSSGDIAAVMQRLQQIPQASVYSFPSELGADRKLEAPGLQGRLKRLELSVFQTHLHLRDAADQGHLVSPGAQWLLDNAHALRAHISDVADSLSPQLLDGVRKREDGLPAVATLAQTVVEELDGVIEEDRIIAAIREAQNEAPLLISEIWLLPGLIRLALVEFIGRQGVNVRRAQQIREEALFWAERLTSAFRLSGVDGEWILRCLASDGDMRNARFAVAVAEQLQDEDRAMLGFQAVVESTLGKRLPELASAEHQAEAQQGLAIANAFHSLRHLAALDFVSIFEQTSWVERELRHDPDSVYQQSDTDTRNRARRAVTEIAKASGVEESIVARAAVEMAKHGQNTLVYLISEGRPLLERQLGAKRSWGRSLERKARKHATFTYVTTILALTFAFGVVAMLLTIDLGSGLRPVLIPLWILALFPLSELSIQIVNMLVISVFQARPLPKMDFKSGIPDERTTLVTVPIMLGGIEDVRHELEKLEIRYLANPCRNLYFSLLSDHVDASQREEPADAAVLSTMIAGIDALNARYPGGRFLAFHRPRAWSESEQRYIGKERKRGKIEELNRYLRGHGDASLLVSGTMPSNPVHYVITLDADTQLPPNSARRLIETIAHPLNRVELDPVTRVRRRGFCIIQPRVSVSLPEATMTRFTRIMGDPHGTDPYCRLVSDSQQDLFGHAIFHGKAIYDVAAFEESLHDRFPPESILSHDLIEGAHCGVGLATDIELFEGMPLDYASFSRRNHRWIRGDWQIGPWMLPKVPSGSGTNWIKNPLDAIHRWRILDNLRRSLVAPASVGLLLVGWFLSGTPAVWTLVLTLAVAIPALAIVLDRIALRLQGSIAGGRGSYDELFRATISLVFLPHHAWLSLDAIVRALYRMLISRRNLLEWQTAASANRSRVSHSSGTVRQLTALAGASALLAVAQAGMLQGSAMPLLVLWAAAPLVMLWLSRSLDPELLSDLSGSDEVSLHLMARKTWRYFDDLVGPQTHWLPPDNTQLALRIEVANRTSPTNIGLWMNSAQAAYDFGYLHRDDLRLRLQGTVSTVERLEKYEGHLLNWYRIDDLSPLPPRYISTVDSGNFLASLWVQQQACKQAIESNLADEACVWSGLRDTFGNLRDVSSEHNPNAAFEMRALRRLLRVPPKHHQLPTKLQMLASLADRARAYFDGGGEAKYWAEKLYQETSSWSEMIEKYGSWLEVLARYPDSRLRQIGSDWPQMRNLALDWKPSLATLAGGQTPLDGMLAYSGERIVDPDLSAWLRELKAEFVKGRRHAGIAVAAWRDLASRMGKLSESINMALLFDAKRKLFGIGYTVGSPLEFNSHYDLLASECRIASLVSIAKGDVPLEHWARLGRPQTPSPGGQQTLLSWSGTMFEYLMPLLFIRSYPNSLLEQACLNAVSRQKEFGAKQGLPWGVSECAYSAIDAGGTYQYHAFGVPALSLRGQQEAERVVAPYATALALQVSPRDAMDNLEELDRLGLDGPMGFYEAIDFSQKPAPESEAGVIIYCYMAHHQGMTLIAIGNLLHHEAMRRRFHDDYRIRAIESVLFERIPNSPLRRGEEIVDLAPPAVRTEVKSEVAALPERMAVPSVQFLGNGRFCTAVTKAGSGYCRWKQFDISRWRSDAASDPWGTYVVLREVKDSGLWSATHHPVGGSSGTCTATFAPDRAAFHRTVDQIESTLEVLVSPEDDVEIRRLKLANWSDRPRAIDVTTFMELALAPHAADRAHPAFSKMFVRTESPQRGVLIATRRKRSPEEAEIWVAQMLTGSVGAVSFETDREVFLGRGNSVETADGFRRSLSNSSGMVVDPVFSLRCRLNLAVSGQEEIGLVTMAAESREALMMLIEKFQRKQAIPQVLELAWNRVQLDLRYLRIGQAEVQQYRRLGSALLFPDPNLRGPADRMSKDRLGQSSLWASGISGDLPILTVTIPDSRSLPLLRELLLTHKYLRMRGLLFDLVILDQEPPSYDRPLQQRIRNLVEALAPESGMDRPGGVFIRDWNILPDSATNQLLAASHVFLRGSRGALNYQLSGQPEQPTLMRPLLTAPRAEEPSPSLPFLELPYFNGMGGFTPDGREYATYLGPALNTPAPWANVIAHESFGTMVTESGLGFTWHGNSQANRLTPWHNDPVSDPQSEIIYIRDEESGNYWSPTALPIRERDAYRARHGQGYTVFEHNSHAIEQELTVFVPVRRDGVGENVKLYKLRLKNRSSRPRVLTVTFFAELVLGTNREEQQMRIHTSADAETGAVFASQWWTGARAGEVAFVASSPRPATFTGDRVQFIGRNRSLAKPDAMSRIKLDNRTGPGLDPAGAVQVSISLPKDGEGAVVFMLGQDATAEECRAIVRRYQDPQKVDEALQESKAFWDTALGKMTVRTPVLSVDLLLNRWLLYQSISCRFWGRSALYQSGGAIGFRDQLQDSLAMLYAFPHLTRRHILIAAGRQFEDGDVQHWWHADTGLGVRTRCSDDLLWLPYVVAHYVEFTGDSEILNEMVGYLNAPELAPDEHEKMFIPAVSGQFGSLREHCLRAIRRGIRLGAHSIPLIGNGDWNDGMNLVGPQGKGESVWLAWFLCTVLQRFAALLEATGGPATAQNLRAQGREIAEAVERSCWDGEWYLRAFFDTGEALGSSKNVEARIDSLAQSWSVLSGMAQPGRAQQAVESARDLLVDPVNKIVKLFAPPFDISRPHPGYIMGYPPGLRENGGQYTHGSLWLAMAFARLGRGDDAERILQMMNPIERTRTADELSRYRGEPYAVAADVSSAVSRPGRSGWTWYTGSAAWMYRIWIEEVLGISVRRNQLMILPAAPASWPGYSLHYKFGSAMYEIEVVFDGAASTVEPCTVDLIDDGKVHHIRVAVRNTGPEKRE